MEMSADEHSSNNQVGQLVTYLELLSRARPAFASTSLPQAEHW
jgi:hypothetical protein